MARSIQLKYKTTTASSVDISFKAEGNALADSFTVKVDGSDANDSFMIHPIEEDWLDITQDKNVINVSVRRNRTLQPRTCVITVEHNAWLSDDAFAYANVTQEAMECSIEGATAVTNFALFPASGKTETVTKTIVAKGGSEKIRVLSVKKYYDKQIKYDKITKYMPNNLTVEAYEELSDLDKLKYTPVIEEKTGTKPLPIQNDGCVGTEILLDNTYTGSGKKYKFNLISYGRTFFKYKEATPPASSDTINPVTITEYEPYYLITVAHSDDLSKQLQFKVTYSPYTAHGGLTPNRTITTPTESVTPSTRKSSPNRATEPVVEVAEPVVPSFIMDIDTDTIEFIHGERESITIPYTAVPEGSILWIRTSSSLITGDYDAENVILRVSPKAWGVEKKVGISIANVNCQNLRYDLTGVIKAL